MTWKIYRWQVYAGLMTAAFLYGLRHPNAPSQTAIGYATDALVFVELVGLWGYAKGYRILVPEVWKVVFPIASLEFVRELGGGVWAVGTASASPGSAALMGSLIIAIIALLQGPMLLALFRYGYRCERFWNAKRAAASHGGEAVAKPSPPPRRAQVRS